MGSDRESIVHMFDGLNSSGVPGVGLVLLQTSDAAPFRSGDGRPSCFGLQSALKCQDSPLKSGKIPKNLLYNVKANAERKNE